MDAFTEKLLERARERHRKLHDSEEGVKTPLKDTNSNKKEQCSVSQPNLNEQKKIPRKEVVSDSAVQEYSENFKENFEGNFKRTSSTRISTHSVGTPQKVYKEVNIQNSDMKLDIKFFGPEDCDVRVEIHEEDVEQTESKPAIETESEVDGDKAVIRDQVKHKLQKLGRLYAGGEDAGLSSPITRTESKFLAEDMKDQEEAENISKPRKGLNKLADLAESINNWEDDLTKSKPIKTNTQVKKSWKPPAPQPPVNSTPPTTVKSPGKSYKKTPAPKPPVTTQKQEENEVSKTENAKTTGPKQLKWDKTVLDTLESQGFTRTTSNTKLVYNYKNSQEKHETAPEKPKTIIEEQIVEKKPTKAQVPGSPVKAKSSIIANKAAIFESPTSSPKKTKDPALMSVSERKALFEKNKGAALIPKAAFGMATPVTSQKPAIAEKPVITEKTVAFEKPVVEKIQNKTVKVTEMIKKKSQNESNDVLSPAKAAIAQSGGIASKMAALLNKKSTISETQIESKIKEQRQKEMDVLLNRFNRNIDEIEEVESDEDNVNETTAMIHSKAPKIVAAKEQEFKSPEKRRSGEKRIKKGDSPQVQAALEDVKRIRVSQPKDGKLYPCLSDIEANTETEPEQEGASNSSYTQSEADSDEGNTSFGREILQAVCKNITPKKRSFEGQSESDTSDILAEMDEYLESDDLSTPGPTPPKHGKLSSSGKKGAQPSESFNYKCFSPRAPPADMDDFKSPAKTLSPRRSENFNVQVVEGENVIPLKHTVSFYRKQTQTQNKTPVKQVSRNAPLIEEEIEQTNDEAEAVQAKIQQLQEEVNKQLTVISQTSQALNLCNATFEFSGSTEQVEAEKLLLLATHRRQAALHEIQRLEVEGTLHPHGKGYENLPREQGSLTISNITLPLKKEYVRALAAAGGKGHHVVCLLKCGEQVLSTKLVSTVATSSKNPDLELAIPGYVRLDKVCSDSAVIFEVYCLQAQQEILPHDVKYHINKKGNNKMTPKKGKQDTRMTRPPKESPAGPHAVRTPSFALMGYAVFSIQAMNRTQWTLNKTPSMSPLEGTVEMKVSCELNVSVEHRGFLTMFEDVSGFGAWHRRWCLLKGHTLSYWKYPDEERKKAPIDSIDLTTCITKQVGPVSREICARLHTLLLERERWAQPGDKDSLTTICNGDKTILRHLLSADTKEERIEWCNTINKALMGLRMWSPKS